MADLVVNKDYFCEWCGHRWKQRVAYSTGNVDPLNPDSKGKKRALSTQVCCPECLRNIPTWRKEDLGDGKKVKVRK